jgi:hypothetical protein
MRRLTNGTERGGRGALRVTALITLLSALLVVPATASAAVDGGLRQLAGTAGCTVDEGSPPAGCVNARGMTDVGKMAISPDGKNVYVPSRGRSALAVFTRNSNGSLTQKPGALGCYTANSTVATEDGCTLISSGLNAVFAVAVSPNGAHVYAAGTSGTIAHFTRNSSGDLTFVGTAGGTGGTTSQIAVSPDNKSVYTSNINEPGGLIGVYQVTASAPGLTFRQCWASSSTGYGCALISDGYVDEPSDLLVTPDSKELILANGDNTSTDYSAGSVVGFPRVTSGPTQGDLSGPTSATCISGNPMANCQQRVGFYYVRGLSTISNSQIYGAGYYGVLRFNRNPSTNALTPITDTSACASYDGNGFLCNTLNSNSNRVFTHRDVLVTSEGKNVYSESENGSFATIFSLSRSSSGAFAPLAAPFQCLSVDSGAGCSRALSNGAATNNLIASPSGRNVYAAGGNRLFAFFRDHAPVCSNVSAGTANNVSVTVTLSCSDPDGDAVTYEKVTDPSRGTLAGISGNHVSYGPQPGTSGVDSFQYRARAAGVASDPATALVNVIAPPSGGGGGGTTPPPVVTTIPSSTSINSLGFKKYTKLLNLAAKNLPAGATVTVTCKTKKKKSQKKGCPYKRKRFTTSGGRGTLNLRKPFKKKKVPVGTKITITITAPGFLGKQIQYTTRAAKIPKVRVRCLSASGKAGSCA